MLHLYLIQNIDYIPCVEYFCRIFILWLKIYTSYSSTSTVHLHTLLSPLVTTNLFSVSVSLLVFVASLIRCVFIFYIGVLSYSICISLNTFLGGGVCVSHLLYLFICCWTLVCFHIITTVNNTMSIGVPVSFRIGVFFFSQICTQEWNCWVIW